jgi:hypothetical protein
MTLSELRDELNELLPYWRDNKIAPDYVLEEVILGCLTSLNGNYQLKDVLPKDVVEMLLLNGKLNHDAGQNYFVISGGVYRDLSYLRPLYETLLSQWNENGWVRKIADGEFVLTDAY